MSQKKKIKENILQMNASYIVTDPSGTTLKSVGKPLADHGYKIQILNLMDRSHSNKFNPFKYVKTKEEINILSVLQQKYGEEFTFKAWSWEKYGSNNKNAYVTCESMPGVEIEVYQRETDNGMTYDEILQDKDTVLSVTILVKCDSDDPQKEEHLEEFRQLLEDNSVRVNGTLIYTSDETTWNEYSENNYFNWYANDDWYLSRCNFSLDKSYQFYKCIKTTW